MTDGSIQMAGERLNQAIARLEQSLAALDSRLNHHLAAPPPIDSALVARHEALKSEVAAVIAELDDMVGASPDRPGASERIMDNG